MQDVYRKINGTEQKSLKKRTREQLIKLSQSSLELCVRTKSKNVIEHLLYVKTLYRGVKLSFDP